MISQGHTPGTGLLHLHCLACPFFISSATQKTVDETDFLKYSKRMKTSEDKKPIGRPKGSCLPPDEATKSRSVRLNQSRWDKLKTLGRAWLERAIDRAKV